MAPEDARKVLHATAIRIDGRREPHRVPRSLRMKLFFYRYRIDDAGYQIELSKLLTGAEQQVLNGYAAQHGQLIEKDALEFRTQSDTIVMSSAGLSAVEIAEQFQALFEKRQSRALARYEGVLSSLSPEGRAIIERFAYERVRPQVTINMPIDLATSAPSLFLEQVAARRLELISR